MKNFLTKKWLGVVLVLAYAVVVGLLFSAGTGPFIEEVSPTILRETEQFLPVTIQNGEITDPVNKEIRRVYQEGEEKFQIVLDTRVDEFAPEAIKEDGVYISKKCVFVKDPKKTERRCFDKNMDTIVITQDLIKEWVDIVKKFAGVWMFCVAVFGILLWYYTAIAL